MNKVLYLTFDDGPIPEVTPWVLEQLAGYNAKATFFCVGENVAKYPHIAAEIVKQGHGLANHTFNHLKGWQTPVADYVQNTALCQEQLNQFPALNTSRKLFRPPYGRISPAQAAILRKEYELIMWDVLTNDYDATLSPELCLEKAVEHTVEGSIIVFHDSLKAQRNMQFALPKFLAHFTAQGYTFEVL
ncbi:polysaccharide deacetylase family protein [Pontibacter arcticus]|uniref:Polysaccharide deacetylase family protein n=1 Tax=Pontibacter arcticus TaxID=2080288 RepID=A0A364RGL4_9BACT|nr:polysaccharide deacetylase family protein [Pontibacter arcticus]RAU83395.1 polysaccharide deacetylase family protein [Pontibacter arcticus]